MNNQETLLLEKKSKRWHPHYCAHHKPEYMEYQRKQAHENYFSKYGPSANKTLQKIYEVLDKFKFLNLKEQLGKFHTFDIILNYYARMACIIK